jgi:hypothetical protein
LTSARPKSHPRSQPTPGPCPQGPRPQPHRPAPTRQAGITHSPSHTTSTGSALYSYVLCALFHPSPIQLQCLLAQFPPLRRRHRSRRLHIPHRRRRHWHWHWLADLLEPGRTIHCGRAVHLQVLLLGWGVILKLSSIYINYIVHFYGIINTYPIF